MPDSNNIVTNTDSTNCRMCNIISNINKNNINNLNIYNWPLIRSPNYIVIPALGHILEGYLMIVSKRHVYSMGCLEDDAWLEFEKLKLYLRNLLRKSYGSLVFFEHGSVSDSNSAGTSVIHAHTHLCPAPEKFFTLVNEQLQIKPVDGHSFAKRSFEEEKPYILIENYEGLCFASNPEQDLPSQFLRRLLSTSLGLEDQWDWRYYPHKQKLISTILTISSLLSDGNRSHEAKNTHVIKALY